MRKNVIMALAIAVVVAVAAVVLLKNLPGLPTNKSLPEEKAYWYSAQPGVEASAIYIPLKDGAVFGVVGLFDFLIGRLDFLYYMSKDSGVVNEVSKVGDMYWKYTHFSRPGMLCKNYTATAAIAGEAITVANSRCRPSPVPLSKARSFDEVVALTHQLFYYDLLLYSPQLNWQKSGMVQTPFGEATVYTSSVSVAGLYMKQYEKQVLQDGTVYLLEIRRVETYTLQNITAVTPKLRGVIDELYKDVVVAKPSGGLDLLRAAQKIGMSYDGEWPAVIAFFDLRSNSSARLFKYNYTLFQGHKLVLVDLVFSSDVQEAHERLRCLYQTSPDVVIPTLRVLYDRFLAKDPNYTSVLPQRRCPFDASAGRKMAQLLLRRITTSLIVVVVYPDDTYTVITGYRPAEIAKALKK